MLATSFYSHKKESKLWLQEKVIKSDNHYLAAQIASSLSVNFWARLSNRKSHMKQKKRMCCLVNHFIDIVHDQPLSILKFGLIEQVSIKTEDFLEQKEGYWKAQLWTYEPYGINPKKEFNSGRRWQFITS